MEMVFTNWLFRRSGCQDVQVLVEVLYCALQEAETAPSALSVVKPFPDGVKSETADVAPFVQM
jgi:hypothetical protein